jgi:dihydroneopterin aldolase
VGGKIVVRGIRALGRHGDQPNERDHPQPFVVDVELSLDVDAAAASDDLSDTVDYGRVVGEVRAVVEKESFALVERLASEIAARVLKLGGEKVKVLVSKPGAAQSLGVREISVRVKRSS